MLEFPRFALFGRQDWSYEKHSKFTDWRHWPTIEVVRNLILSVSVFMSLVV